MYQYDEIELSVVKNLTSKILNKAFHKLVENDIENFPIQDYSPNIWENKWFNDNGIAGYSKGDCVWTYTVTEDQFLNAYGDLVYSYCQENDRLKNVIVSSWTDICKAGKESNYKKHYRNVISGYSEPIYDESNKSLVIGYRQLCERMFDYGYQTALANRIVLYISTKDDNKSFLEDSMYWQKVVISSQVEYDNFIYAQLSSMFQQHLQDYHLGGIIKTSELNDTLLKRDLANFNIGNVYNAPRVTNVANYINTEGFDCVIKFAKREYEFNVNGKQYKTYKMFRLWNSGYLEHFGVVSADILPEKESSYVSSYIQNVEFDWEYEDNAEESCAFLAPTYNYPTTSSYYDKSFVQLNYATGKVESGIQTLQQEPNCHYSVSLTPVCFNMQTDLSTNGFGTEVIADYSTLSSIGYPEKPLDNINKSYLAPEIHHMTNRSFSFTKTNTDDLSKSDIAFYQYYVTGYKINVDVDGNIKHAIVENLLSTYYYTASEIKPEIRVYSGDYLLKQDVDYNLTYYNNIQVGNATIDIIGIGNFRNIKTVGFKIINDIADIAITNLSACYAYDIKVGRPENRSQLTYFISDGDNGDVAKQIVVEIDTAYQLSDVQDTYRYFTGWKIGDSAYNDYYAVYNVNGPVNAFMVQSGILCKLSYDANGGSGDMTEDTYIGSSNKTINQTTYKIECQNCTTILKECKFTQVSSAFYKWEIGQDEYDSGQTYTIEIGSTKVAKAIWVPIAYKSTADVKVESIQDISQLDIEISVEQDDTQTPLFKVVRCNSTFDFIGWKDDFGNIVSTSLEYRHALQKPTKAASKDPIKVECHLNAWFKWNRSGIIMMYDDNSIVSKSVDGGILKREDIQ